MNQFLEAFLWGLGSAVSLPLGAMIALFWDVPKKWNCALLAFGSGALLFALTIELFGKSICQFELALEEGEADRIPMVSIAGGAVAGAILFFFGNLFVENQGGFFRKFGLTAAYFRKFINKENDDLDVEDNGLVDRLSYRSIRSIRSQRNSIKPSHLKEESPLIGEDDHEHEHTFMADDSMDGVSQQEIIDRILQSQKDAHIGIAIWLGILIDSFPESLVIGILAGAEGGISITFVMGVFLSNFPEALSSSVIMRRGGISPMRIMLMWSSIMLITGFGAGFGAFAFSGEETYGKEIAAKTMEGVAAGAMLVMIAETALPEAFRHAGNLVGFSTLFGFLAAFLVKLAEG